LEVGPLDFVVEYELSTSALHRLEQRAQSATAGSPEADVVEDAVAVVQEDEVLPMIEELEEVPDSPPHEAREEEPDWHLPQTNELRDLLSQLDTPKTRPRRREP